MGEDLWQTAHVRRGFARISPFSRTMPTPTLFAEPLDAEHEHADKCVRTIACSAGLVLPTLIVAPTNQTLDESSRSS